MPSFVLKGVVLLTRGFCDTALSAEHSYDELAVAKRSMSSSCVGLIFNSRFRCEKRIGSGSFGEVYLGNSSTAAICARVTQLVFLLQARICALAARFVHLPWLIFPLVYFATGRH